jgi:hypothetical protein
LSVSGSWEARLKVSDQSEDCDEKFHEAGWDSFCTGYCFIRMAHIYASLSFGRYVQSNMLVYSYLVLGVVIPGKER